METAKITNKIQIPFIVVEKMKYKQGNTVENSPDFCQKGKRKEYSRKKDEIEKNGWSTIICITNLPERFAQAIISINLSRQKKLNNNLK